jgi:hypothetical protein
MSSVSSPREMISQPSSRGLNRRNSLSFNIKAIKVSEVLDKNEVHSDEVPNYFEIVRMELKKKLTNSSVAFHYENFFAIISIASCLEFIYHTYFDNNNPDFNRENYNMASLEIVFACIFMMDWFLQLFLADHAPLYIRSFSSVVDMSIFISTIATYGKDSRLYGNLITATDVVMYFLFGLRTVRILRTLCCLKKLNRIEDAVSRFIGEISLSGTIILLFFAALMQYLEEEIQPFMFHTWIYYMWVTMATVGYGDISPQTTCGRIMAMAMIGFAIISVPKMTNELLEKMKLQSVYARANYAPKSKSSKHVIICGDISSTSLRDFFGELFHEDHENTDLNAIMLLPGLPTSDIIFLMRDPQFFLSLTYLEGSALSDNDLKRAKAETSQAIFVMTNKFSLHPDEEDSKSILLSFSIKRYISNFYRPNLLFCIQLIRPENRKHLTMDEFEQVDDSDLVVCLNEIKLGVMARSVVYPGTNTLIMNLLSSFSDDALEGADNDKDEDDADKERSTSGRSQDGSTSSDRADNQNSKDWIQEYMNGCGWEIYTTSLSKVFVGAKFCELSYALYDKVGVVLFALQITDKENGGASKVLLNPANFIIPDGDKYLIEAFVIAQNQQSSDLSFSDNEGDDNHTVGVIKSSISDYRPPPEERRFSVMALKRGSKFLNSIIQSNAGVGGAKRGDAFDEAEEEDQGTGDQKKKQELAKSKAKSRWGLLKRNSMLKKKVETFSYQEALVHLEEEHFYRNYYVLAHPVSISEATVKTSVIDELPFINQHLIIIGKGLNNLYDLIRPLRAKYLGPLKYIVLLYPFDIPEDVWHRISIFEAIVFVRGSPLEESNLRRAGIFRASQVVVLGDGSNESGGGSTGMEALVDSEAIFAYQHVKRMNPSTQVVVEIVNQSNVGYLNENVNDSNNDYKFSSQFAAGIVFTTSILDSIVCQAYYNPQIIKVVNKLVSGVDQTERADLADEAQKKMLANANGEILSDSDDSDFESGSMKRMSGKKPSLARLKSDVRTIEGSCLYQISLPENLPKKTYGALYQHLAQNGMVPLGIYRGIFSNMNIGPKSNRMPYVFTNPSKDTELYSCDRVFVLATSPPAQSANGPKSVKDWVMGLQMQKNMAKAIESVRSRSGSGVAQGGLDVSKLEKSQRRLGERLGKVEKDVSKKLDQLFIVVESKLHGGSSAFQRELHADSPALSENENGGDGTAGSGLNGNNIPAKPESILRQRSNSVTGGPRKVSFSEVSNPAGAAAVATAVSMRPGSVSPSRIDSPPVASMSAKSSRKSGGNGFLQRVIALKDDDPVEEKTKAPCMDSMSIQTTARNSEADLSPTPIAASPSLHRLKEVPDENGKKQSQRKVLPSETHQTSNEIESLPFDSPVRRKPI